jgi:hypothetical protein
MPSTAGRANIAPFARQHELPATRDSHPQIIATDVDAVGEARPLLLNTQEGTLYFENELRAREYLEEARPEAPLVRTLTPSAALTTFST